MVLIDKELPWTVDNIQFITRLEHFKTSSHYKGRILKRRKDPKNARTTV
jgi:hypothetical protein